MKNLIFLILILLVWGCSSNKNLTDEKLVLKTIPEIINTNLEIEFLKGKKHNHPSFAFWIEDLDGNYIETIFTTQFVASGKFGHG